MNEDRGAILLASSFFIVSAIFFLRTPSSWAQNSDPSQVVMPPKAAKTEQDHSTFYSGYALYTRGKLDEAIKTFTRGLETNPESADCHYGLGFTLQKQRKLEQALQHYNLAIKFNPRLADAYNDRGNLFVCLGRLDEAIRDYSVAILISPWNAANYEDRAQAYLEKKEYSKVIADATKAIELDKSIVRAYKHRAAAWQAINKPIQALQDLNQACKNDKETIYSLYERARLKIVLSDFAGALSDYSQALERKPNDPIILRERASLYEQMEDFEKAKLDVSKLKECYKNSKELLALADDWLRVLDDYQEDRTISDLSDTERYPLLLTLLYWQQYRMGTHSLYGGENCQANRSKARKILDDSFGVKNREELIERLEELMLSGDNRTWLCMGEAINSGASPMQIDFAVFLCGRNSNDKEALLDQLRKQFVNSRESGLLGWDLARYIVATREGFIAGYLSRAEAKSRMLAASLLLQTHFKSYTDCNQNILIGKAAFQPDTYRQTSESLHSITNWIKTSRLSPWKQIPFNISLVQASSTDAENKHRSD